jgi:phospholipid transport system substrate-binding protein
MLIKKILKICLMLLVLSTSVFADNEPKAVIKKGLDDLIGIIIAHRDDKDFSKRDEKIREIFYSSFDLVKMSGMTLGRTIWKEKLSNDQKQRFINKYAEFILTFYISKLSEYNDNKIEIKDPLYKSKGKKATVLTTVEFNGTDAKVQYSLSKTSKGWRIYDVEVEGVRLTTTYRSQFQGSFNKKGFDLLITELDNLIKRVKEGEEKKGEKSPK